MVVVVFDVVVDVVDVVADGVVVDGVKRLYSSISRVLPYPLLVVPL